MKIDYPVGLRRLLKVANRSDVIIFDLTRGQGYDFRLPSTRKSWMRRVHNMAYSLGMAVSCESTTYGLTITVRLAKGEAA